MPPTQTSPTQASQVSPTGFSPSDQATFDSILQAHNYVPPASGGDSAPAQNWRSLIPSAPQPSYLQRVGSDVSGAVQSASEAQQKGAASGTVGGEFAAGAKIASDVSGAVVSPFAEAMPQPVKDFLGKVSSSLSDTTPVKALAELMNRFPELSDTLTNLAQTGLNIVGTVGGGDGASGVKDVISTELNPEPPFAPVGRPVDAAVMQKATEAKAGQALAAPVNESKISDLYNRAIRPTVAGKSNATQVAQSNTRISTGLKSIVANKDNLKFTNSDGEQVTGQSPSSVDELSQAIDQTKSAIFQKYDALAKQAGEKGAEVDGKKIASELQDVANSKSLALTNPKAVQYAKDIQDRLTQTGSIDAQTAQDVIQHYNSSLKAFYRNPNYDTASQASIDALVANKFREQLDAGITGATGEQYQSLKNEFGALASMEKDVAHRNIVWGRQNKVGLAGNLANIASGAELVRGLLSMNPADIGASVIIKGMQKYAEYLNNPDVGVKRIFSELEKSNLSSKESTKAPTTIGKVKSPSGSTISSPPPKVQGGVPETQGKILTPKGQYKATPQAGKPVPDTDKIVIAESPTNKFTDRQQVIANSLSPKQMESFLQMKQKTASVFDEFRKGYDAIHKEAGLDKQPFPANRKSDARAIEKAWDKYKIGESIDFSKVKDMNRGSFVVPDSKTAQNVLASIHNHFKGAEVEVRHTPEGYRDIQAFVPLSNGTKGELQILYGAMDKTKNVQHANYEIQRALAGEAMKRALTPDELSRYNKAIQDQKKAYDAAWSSISK